MNTIPCVKITVTGGNLEALSQHVIIIFQLAIIFLLCRAHESYHFENIMRLMSSGDIYKNFAEEKCDTWYQILAGIQREFIWTVGMKYLLQTI